MLKNISRWQKSHMPVISVLFSNGVKLTDFTEEGLAIFTKWSNLDVKMLFGEKLIEMIDQMASN